MDPFNGFHSSTFLQLDVELQSLVGLLEATLTERPPQITRELPAVLQVLMPLLNSPLAAPRIQQVFLDIGVCLMPKHLHHLGTGSVCHVLSSNTAPAPHAECCSFSPQLCSWDTSRYAC